MSFDVIEQVVLARNRSQHGEHLSLLGVRHDPGTVRKHPDLIFANEKELSVWASEGASAPTWFAPRLDITDDALAAAIAEIERLADWIDERITATAPFRRA